jgi:hypothetical protein
MRPASVQYHPDLNAICNQLTELANVTIPQMGDSVAGSDPDSMGRWLNALGVAVLQVRSIAETPYPYDNSH